MREIFRRPYVYWIIGIFFVYMIANVLLSQFYDTARYIPYYVETVKWTELLISAAFALVIGTLISINSVLAYLRYLDHKKIGTQGGVTCVATIGGFATGICPACIPSVFPLIFGAFGITFSWISLPFRGIEIQILIIVLLLGSLYLMKGKK